jgi:lipopolysaccharide transport system permease protein
MSIIIVKYFREMLLSPMAVTKNIFHYRHILIQMITIEIKGRFAGSLGGLLWNFIHPLLMLIVYLFVFVYIFKFRIGVAGGSLAAAVYIMAGLFPWIIIAEGLSRGTTSMVENTNLIQKTYFPIEILTAKAVLTPVFSHGIAILLLALYKIIATGSFEILYLLPFIVMLQIFFTLGIAFFTSTISVFFRDVIQLMQIIVSFWIFLTPILYPVSMLPDWAKKVMYINPLYPLISLYQDLFVNEAPVQWDMLYLSVFWSLLFFFTGAFIFHKLKHEFADWL